MQIQGNQLLWPFQAFIYKGWRCCLTRIGFELNVSLAINEIHCRYHTGKKMSLSDRPSQLTDDIYINENILSTAFK